MFDESCYHTSSLLIVLRVALKVSGDGGLEGDRLRTVPLYTTYTKKVIYTWNKILKYFLTKSQK